MSKIRTLGQLQDSLDREFSWRIKEIASLKLFVRKSDTLSKWTMVRASLPLLYAHWEGFIKNAATRYLDFVNGQNIQYCDLQSCFIVFGIKKHISDITSSRKAAISIATLDFIRSELNEKAKLKMDSAIRTESNLSSSVFENIATSIGIDSSSYEARYNLIDESLLNRRNHIAHGEYLDLDPDEFRRLADEVLSLMRTFKTDIENAASTSRYKLAA